MRTLRKIIPADWVHSNYGIRVLTHFWLLLRLIDPGLSIDKLYNRLRKTICEKPEAPDPNLSGHV